MLKVKIGEKVLEVDDRRGDIEVNGKAVELDLLENGPGNYHIVYGTKSYNAEIVSTDWQEKKIILKINGQKLEADLKDDTDLLLERLGMDMSVANLINDLKAPMPGLILDILVEPGQEIKKDDPLIVLEAMKMENVIKSPGEAVVSAIKVKKGESVEKNQLLIQF
ncbi:biotin/lipoyl-containing protein [Roseivirga sp. BDSF3-8]|uniref:biotin/lipoyl-containing protein n=1 Tax=Roseivirga sp. BDSF3-8 TaxID=3241598 RepID=UPI003532360A